MRFGRNFGCMFEWAFLSRYALLPDRSGWLREVLGTLFAAAPRPTGVPIEQRRSRTMPGSLSILQWLSSTASFPTTISNNARRSTARLMRSATLVSSPTALSLDVRPRDAPRSPGTAPLDDDPLPCAAPIRAAVFALAQGCSCTGSRGAETARAQKGAKRGSSCRSEPLWSVRGGARPQRLACLSDRPISGGDALGVLRRRGIAYRCFEKAARGRRGRGGHGAGAGRRRPSWGVVCSVRHRQRYSSRTL